MVGGWGDEEGVVAVGVGDGDVAAGVAKYLSGKRSDLRGAKPFITAGYSLAGFGKVLVAAANVWPTVLFGRVVDRIGKGVRSAPRDALIAASVPPGDYGKAFGFHRMGDTLGAVIGPLLGLLALGLLHDNIRAALWWAVVPAVLSVLLVFLVREPRIPPVPEPVTAPASPVARETVLHGSPLPRSFWRVAVTLVVIAVVNFPDALLPWEPIAGAAAITLHR